MTLQGVGSDFVRKVQSAYLDALYAFLDGLVELAFSAPEAIFAPEQPQTRLKRVFTARNEDPRSKEIDVHNVVRMPHGHTGTKLTTRCHRTSASC